LVLKVYRTSLESVKSFRAPIPGELLPVPGKGLPNFHAKRGNLGAWKIGGPLREQPKRKRDLLSQIAPSFVT
jgi:hypothetical protein